MTEEQEKRKNAVKIVAELIVEKGVWTYVNIDTWEVQHRYENEDYFFDRDPRMERKNNEVREIIRDWKRKFTFRPMIMVIIILYVVKTAPFRPETNRSRTYYFTSILSKGKADNRRMSYGAIGIPYIKACILPLKSAEIVTIVSRDDRNKPMASTMDGLNIYSAVISQTDDVFWRLFDFDFIDGKAFTAADVKSEIKNAIISETVARKLFGTTHCTGKQIKLDFLNYRVAGVVRNVSRFADKAWADIWVPYTTMDSYKNSYEEGINGSMKCYVLLKKGYTWDDMHKEVLRLQAVYNATLKDFKADIGYQPRSQTEQNISGDNEKETNMSRMYIRYGIVLFVLLLVPVLNLSGITLSRMRRRMPELGVRRAYGATKWNILWQVLNENLVYTLIGGVIGLAFSYVAMFMPICLAEVAISLPTRMSSICARV